MSQKCFWTGISQKGNSFLGNFDGLHKQFFGDFGIDFQKEISFWKTQKGNFDGWHKQLKNDFGKKFPFLERIGISKKGNYMLENSEKCQKNPKKYWKNSHGSGKCWKCKINVLLAGKCWKNSEKISKNSRIFVNIFQKLFQFFSSIKQLINSLLLHFQLPKIAKNK